MRGEVFVEKRRARRLNMSFPITLQFDSDTGKEKVREGLTVDISFYGAYVKDVSRNDIKPEDKLNVFLFIPKDDRDEFPFSRFVGKAKVVRVEKDAIAIDFKEDMFRLSVAAS